MHVNKDIERSILERQKQEALSYTERLDFEVHKVYEDVDNGSIEKRPGLSNLLDGSKQDLFSLVVFPSLTRIDRDMEAVSKVLKELKRHNVGWHFVDQDALNFEPWNHDRRRDLTIILSAIGKGFKKQASESIRASIKKCRADGVRLGRHPSMCICPKHRKAQSLNLKGGEDS